MKKGLIKLSVLSIVFVLSIFTISHITNKGNTDSTTDMPEATYPTMTMVVEDKEVNCLHGYGVDMAENYMRDTITPLTEDRSVRIKVNDHGTLIKSVSYEIRSMDTTRLVENITITDYEYHAGIINATLSFKDLMEKDQEYILTIILETEYAEKICYYTRVIQTEELYTAEKIAFVEDFHQKTFDKEKAEELTIYLESNAQGDNSSFQHVDIHSSFDQVTWGNMEVTVEREAIPSLKELSPSAGTIQMDYVVSIRNEKGIKEYFDITEIYRIHYTKSRIYLMEYDRTMNQILDDSNLKLSGTKLNLGITNTDVEMEENDSGNIVCFVQEGSLFYYNADTNKLACVFRFGSVDNLDLRNHYNQHDIKISDIDEVGNVRFIVYGYMNRGIHEGKVGIGVYFYNSITNSIEEEVFVPSEKPYQLLKEDVRVLSYINGENELFLLRNGTIYEINLVDRSYAAIASGLIDGCYQVSEENGMIAWQEEKALYDSFSVDTMNLETKEKYTITVAETERVKPLGFMGEDFVYGIARKDQIVKDINGSVIFPMYCLRIQNRDNELISEYQINDIYIQKAEIQNNMINLNRIMLNPETGEYVTAEDDQIVSKEVENGHITQIVTGNSDLKEKEVQLTLGKEMTGKKPKVLTPKEVIFQESRDIVLENEVAQPSRYYVFAKGQLDSIYIEAKEAIIRAEETTGVVVSDAQEYIWEKGNRKTRIQIDSIEAVAATEEYSSLAICLNAMLLEAETSQNASALLEQGDGALTILKEQIDGEVLDLSGCSLDAALYFVNRGYPVLAILDDSHSILIIGYDEFNTILMDPETGTIYKKGLNDSKSFFEEAGNRFISFVK